MADNAYELELLRRASDKLNDYCAEINGDMNDSLAEEIDRHLETIKRGVAND